LGYRFRTRTTAVLYCGSLHCGSLRGLRTARFYWFVAAGSTVLQVPSSPLRFWVYRFAVHRAVTRSTIPRITTFRGYICAPRTLGCFLVLRGSWFVYVATRVRSPPVYYHHARLLGSATTCSLRVSHLVLPVWLDIHTFAGSLRFYTRFGSAFHAFWVLPPLRCAFSRLFATVGSTAVSRGSCLPPACSHPYLVLDSLVLLPRFYTALYHARFARTLRLLRLLRHLHCCRSYHYFPAPRWFFYGSLPTGSPIRLPHTTTRFCRAPTVHAATVRFGLHRARCTRRTRGLHAHTLHFLLDCAHHTVALVTLFTHDHRLRLPRITRFPVQFHTRFSSFTRTHGSATGFTRSGLVPVAWVTRFTILPGFYVWFCYCRAVYGLHWIPRSLVRTITRVPLPFADYTVCCVTLRGFPPPAFAIFAPRVIYYVYTPRLRSCTFVRSLHFTDFTCAHCYARFTFVVVTLRLRSFVYHRTFGLRLILRLFCLLRTLFWMPPAPVCTFCRFLVHTSFGLLLHYRTVRSHTRLVTPVPTLPRSLVLDCTTVRFARHAFTVPCALRGYARIALPHCPRLVRLYATVHAVPHCTFAYPFTLHFAVYRLFCAFHTVLRFGSCRFRFAPLPPARIAAPAPGSHRLRHRAWFATSCAVYATVLSLLLRSLRSRAAIRATCAHVLRFLHAFCVGYTFYYRPVAVLHTIRLPRLPARTGLAFTRFWLRFAAVASTAAYLRLPLPVACRTARLSHGFTTHSSVSLGSARFTALFGFWFGLHVTLRTLPPAGLPHTWFSARFLAHVCCLPRFSPRTLVTATPHTTCVHVRYWVACHLLHAAGLRFTFGFCGFTAPVLPHTWISCSVGSVYRLLVAVAVHAFATTDFAVYGPLWLPVTHLRRCALHAPLRVTPYRFATHAVHPGYARRVVHTGCVLRFHAAPRFVYWFVPACTPHTRFPDYGLLVTPAVAHQFCAFLPRALPFSWI